jgi:autotransporter-associated beta strand protein
MPATNLQNPGQVTAGGPAGFRKTGAGTLTLTAANTFTGDVAIEQGTLSITGSLAAGGSVQVSAGSLAGTGFIDKAIILAPSGVVSPGIGGPGTLSVASLAWSGGGTVAYDLGAASDQLTVAGAFTKGAAGTHTFAFNPAGLLPIGGSFTLATFASTDFVATDFSATGLGYAKGYFSVDAGSVSFTVTSDGSGQTAYLTWAGGYVFPTGLEGPAADADGDGQSNLLEFILGQNPLAGGVENVTLITVSEGGADYPALRFTRRIARGDIALEVRVNTDLDFADSLGAVLLSAVDQGNGTELVTVRSAASYAVQPKQVLRLEATLP